MKIKYNLILLLLFVASVSKGQDIQQIVNQLTIEEKVMLCSGKNMWETQEIERLEIPSIMMTDGPHGVRKAKNGQFGEAYQATCFPTAVTLASTWNLSLAKEVGVALGEEAKSQNIQILLGPGTNIKRSPLGGRNFEYFSEDPTLSGDFSVAYINGVQETGVGVSLKHFAVNDQEHERMTISSEVSERAIREVYLRPFEIAVKESNPTTIMCSYNKINGVYAANNEWLLDDVLRKEWGYEGIVVTDWGAVDDRVQGIRAKLHLQMPGDGGLNNQKIVAAVKDGTLDEAVLNEVVADILKVTFEVAKSKDAKTSFSEKEHHQLAYQVASEGIVLLKNDGNILPLKKKDKVAIIGNFAKQPRYQGSGSSLVNPFKIDNLIDHLDGTFAKGYDLLGKTNQTLIDEAVSVAKKADKVVLVVGLTFLEESEGFDREGYKIAEDHIKLLNEITKVNNNVIVVLENGSPVEMEWIDAVDAVVEAYLGGQAGGSALADVLKGKVNPSGKLAESFPVKIEDNPTYIAWAGEEGKTYYNEGIFVGYKYYEKKKIKPLFPFGFGLSYTQFNLSKFELDKKEITDKDAVTAKVYVENSGELVGQEVVQLYISNKASKLQQPVKALKHFKKIALSPGKGAYVEFTLTSKDFETYSEQMGKWIIESGQYDIMIGNSSDNIIDTITIELKSNQINQPLYTKYTLLKEILHTDIGKKVITGITNNLVGDRKEVDESTLTEKQKIDKMKGEILLSKLFLDMPLKNLIQFGVVTEEQLNFIIMGLNQPTTK